MYPFPILKIIKKQEKEAQTHLKCNSPEYNLSYKICKCQCGSRVRMSNKFNHNYSKVHRIWVERKDYNY